MSENKEAIIILLMCLIAFFLLLCVLYGYNLLNEKYAFCDKIGINDFGKQEMVKQLEDLNAEKKSLELRISIQARMLSSLFQITELAKFYDKKLKVCDVNGVCLTLVSD